MVPGVVSFLRQSELIEVSPRAGIATIRDGGARLVIKSYQQVSPTRYPGVAEGVQIREMITTQDGAPNFAMRVFDVQPGLSTPFHTHAWEHEVSIISGTGRVREEGKETPLKAGDSVYIAPMSSTVSWPTPPPRFK